MSSAYYTYEQALQKVEKFMIDSGIRSFCKNICKGECCRKCYERGNSCNKNGERRLACSAFVCLQLRNLIFSKREEKIILNIEHSSASIIMEVVHINPYFNVNTKGIRDDFIIESSIIDKLCEMNVERINDKISSLRELLNKMAQHARWRKKTNEA